MSDTVAVVPTLGWSPRLAETLAALQADGGARLETVVVWQGEASPPRELAADRLVTSVANLGFSGAINLALADGDAPFVALVNDDATVEPGWLATMHAGLAEAREVAAVQGVNLRDEGTATDRIDGCGLAWNKAWQAVQVGRSAPALAPTASPFEVFGVSATAALYRREALLDASLRPGELLDASLFAYYEDVDLACRLRGRGRSALCVPAARARHLGSVSGERMGDRRWIWIHAHRLLVLARLLGRRFWPRLPRFLLRDLADTLSPRAARPGPAALGAAWGAAWRLLPRFAHRGPSLVPLAELARFRVGSDGWPPRPSR